MISRVFDASDGQVVVEISYPEEIDGRWSCSLIIREPPEEERCIPCNGVDSLDALLYAIKIAHVNLTIANEEGKGVTWLGSADLGLEMLVKP